MSKTPGRTRTLGLVGLLVAISPAWADEPQAPKQEAAAAAAQAPSAQTASVSEAVQQQAPKAAYIIEQNQDSQVAKREVPGGWREVNVKGVVYWCQENKSMGSRVKRETRCVTPQQYDLMEEETQKTIDDGRRNTLPPKGG